MILAALSTTGVGQEKSIKFDTDPQQRLDVRYRLFKTENIWNLLLLDTRLGLVYQLQYSIEDRKGP